MKYRHHWTGNATAPPRSRTPVDLRLLPVALCLALLWSVLASVTGAGSRAWAQALQDTATVGLTHVQAWSSADGNATAQVAWGDVDGDGDLDLAAGGYPSIRVYANEGGVLQPSAIWTSAGTDDITSIAWGDVDGDGDLDLAAGNQFGPNKLYENVGGVLQSSAMWSSDDRYDSAPSLAWGDVDGDGDLDLAMGTRRVNDGGLTGVYINEGGVLQGSATLFSDDRDDTSSIAWGDVDGDGDLDLAVSNFGGPNKLYLNEDGVLQESAAWISDDSVDTFSLAWGDVDGDGDFDLAVGNAWPFPNKVYKNEDGMLQRVAMWTSADSDDVTVSVVWGDVDGDGDLDLAAGNRYGRTAVYTNSGGMLQADATWYSDDSYATESIAWGDVDGDGDLDLAVGNFEGPDKLYINRGPVLQTTASWSSDNSDAIRDIAWGDVDGDGDLDLAVGSDWGAPDKLAGAAVYANEGGVLQTSPIWTPDGEYYESISNLAWGDVDGDGDLDLAVSGYSLKVYANQDGALQTSAIWSSSEGGGSLAWGDVDGDGDLDLATAGGLYANENGVLQTAPIWTPGDEYATTDIAWGDVDGDGDLDLAVSHGWRAGASVYINADGVLPTNPTWSSSEKGDTSSVAWGDMDGDGNLDLAVGGLFGFPNVVYLSENGMLQTQAAWSSADSDETTKLAWGDVDGDGDLDLAAANWERYGEGNAGGPNRLYVNEGGMLQPTAAWSSVDGGYADSVAWGDVDGDGDLDLAVGGSSLKIYANGRPSHPLFAGQSEAVSIALNSSPVSSDPQTATALAPANFYAVAGIRASATIPISYTIDYPDNQFFGRVRVLFSPTGGGDWRPAVGENKVTFRPNDPSAQGTDFAELAEAEHSLAATVRSDAAHRLYIPLMAIPEVRGKIQGVFDWDLFASGVFGQSDNMVVRVEVLPYLGPVRNGIPGPFQRPFVSAQTYPFRVRGTQVRVLDEAGAPVVGAQVYRLPAGQTAGAMPIAAADGTPFVTNSQGYLQGSGVLAQGDGLVALVPVTVTHAFTLYHMSAAPTATGLDLFTVQAPGVQELRVAQTNPLALFSLDMSLEWDARNDGTFLNDLEAAIQGASDILFDITNGQAAVGQVRVHQAKEHWANSHVVVYATNGIHPRASIGGIVATPVDDQGVDGPIPGAYLPGQVRMGPLWDPFGESQVELSEDWQRALAHELAHYLLFLPDNYLGFDQGLLALVDCQGSFMTNAYDDDYSELLTRDRWDQQETCRRTVAQQLTGRSDWETVMRFLPWLQAPPSWAEVNPGPAMLPLAVPQISFVDPPGAPDATLPALNVDLRHRETGELIAVRQAQAYLFTSGGTGGYDTDITDDQVIALGSTGRGADRIKVRGAAVDDRLCVLAPNDALLGCTVLTNTTRSVTLQPTPGWQPDIVVTPVNSTTLAITVTQAVSGAELYVQVFPAYASPDATGPLVAPWAAMQRVGPDTFSQLIVLDTPVFEGFVRVWMPGSRPHREAVTQFFLSAGWGPNARGSANNRNVWGPNARGSANTRAWGANYRTMEAPIASGDGRVTIFNLENLVGDNGGTALQALATLPDLPLWLTPVGLGYRFVATEIYTRTIAFHYLQREVPEGYEQTLTLYYSPDEGRSWQRLATNLDVEENLASAFMPQNAQGGQGIYTLQAAVEMPPLTPGWNLFNYPIPQARPVATALASIAGAYTSVYRYDAGQDRPWWLYDARVADEHPDLAPLVNELDEMVLGPSYWLFATEVITPVLAVPDHNATAALFDEAADVLGLPPATFYGPVRQTDAFQPEPGMTVTAQIGDLLCGQATLQAWQETLVYVLQVASRKEVEGCGTEGAQVLLQIDGRLLDTVTWSNHQANFVPLPGE